MEVDNLQKIKDVITKYGWTVEKKTNSIFYLSNRKNRMCSILIIKGDKYTMYPQTLELPKLMSGKGNLTESIDKVLNQYFYVSKIA